MLGLKTTYTGKIMLKYKYGENNYTPYCFGGKLSIKSRTLESALKDLEEEGQKQFPDAAVIHVDKVYNCLGLEVYTTAWDEVGPIAGFSGFFS